MPPGWQGGLPLAYHVGPGPAEVHFAIAMDYKVRTIWNVIATLKGTVEPDRWVMVGNHRDAWVYGAVDPGSGTAATLEMCRALGAAVKNGWKPRRTLVYASWDAEEYGLVGSTEWAEDHAKEIDEKAVLLLNVDSAVGGHELDLDGVPSLRDLMLDAAAAVTDVRSGQTAPPGLDREAARRPGPPNAGRSPRPRSGTPASAPTRPRPGRPRSSRRSCNALGSGSDYTAFLDHLGVPAVDVGFSGRYGVYHSVYDNFYWMEKFGDPEFLTHAMAARLYTVLAMRAAGAEVVPLKFVPYGEALRDYSTTSGGSSSAGARGRSPARRQTADRVRGLAALVKAVRGVPGPGRRARPGHRDLAAPRRRRSRSAREGQRRPDAGRTRLPAPRRPPRPPLVQARGLRPGLDHRLRLLAPARRPPGLSRTTPRCSPRRSPLCRPARRRDRGPPARRRGRQGRLTPSPRTPRRSGRRRDGDPRQADQSPDRPTSRLPWKRSRMATDRRTRTRVERQGTLPRVLGPVEAFCVVVGSVIGSGIFIVPAEVAHDVPCHRADRPGLDRRRPLQRRRALDAGRAGGDAPAGGGPYVYLREAYGPLPAFLFGWTEFLVMRAGSMATLAAAFARYFAQVVPPPDGHSASRSGRRSRPSRRSPS